MPRGVYARHWTAEHQAAAAERMRNISNAHRYTDWHQNRPDESFAVHSAIGKKQAAKVWRCEEPGCGRVMRGATAFWHQKAKRHEGLTRLDLIGRDNQGDSA